MAWRRSQFRMAMRPRATHRRRSGDFTFANRPTTAPRYRTVFGQQQPGVWFAHRGSPTVVVPGVQRAGGQEGAASGGDTRSGQALLPSPLHPGISHPMPVVQRVVHEDSRTGRGLGIAPRRGRAAKRCTQPGATRSGAATCERWHGPCATARSFQTRAGRHPCRVLPHHPVQRHRYFLPSTFPPPRPIRSSIGFRCALRRGVRGPDSRAITPIELVRKGRAVVFDTETTGLSDMDEIVQIAAVELMDGTPTGVRTLVCLLMALRLPLTPVSVMQTNSVSL